MDSNASGASEHVPESGKGTDMTHTSTTLILSAGFSSRMGDFKPLLPLGGMTVLERSVSLFRSAGVEDIRVVIGHRAEELQPLLTHLGVRGILNPRYREGMFTSVVAGAETIADGRAPFFVIPVDIPLVRTATIRHLLEEYEEGRDDVLYPAFQGVRGHPPLIAARHAREIVKWRGNDGLRGALGQWEDGSRSIAVSDGHILNDMDTPEAYAGLLEKVTRYEIPTEAECMALLEMLLPADSPIIRHGRAVADLALTMAGRLNRHDYDLDTRLLEAAGLLHDLARAEADHAQAGARLLREAGFGAVAELVASHMDITPGTGVRITPHELLYLADKLVQGDRRVTLSERFRVALERHGHDPAILKNVTNRLHAALSIQTRLEATLGCPMAEVISRQ
ncbi:metal dependent phosphohydrolase [Pelobacter propionicus DSM 2379]|uniref:Metal dependent phosphohydrolase n=2 Tax=Pelobacter propionicus TaxID=29543 RepID=A1AP90_PELPD|nr:metal dependent phosphohydrolase [Pelobacter propionicus DSM 2379]